MFFQPNCVEPTRLQNPCLQHIILPCLIISYNILPCLVCSCMFHRCDAIFCPMLVISSDVEGQISNGPAVMKRFLQTLLKLKWTGSSTHPSTQSLKWSDKKLCKRGKPFCCAAGCVLSQLRSMIGHCTVAIHEFRPGLALRANICPFGQGLASGKGDTSQIRWIAQDYPSTACSSKHVGTAKK